MVENILINCWDLVMVEVNYDIIVLWIIFLFLDIIICIQFIVGIVVIVMGVGVVFIYNWMLLGGNILIDLVILNIIVDVGVFYFLIVENMLNGCWDIVIVVVQEDVIVINVVLAMFDMLDCF